MTKKIEDYAVIGDGQTVALVRNTGSIDWLCLPRFDSDACFAALLGDDSHGNWTMQPEDQNFKTTRRYVGDTLVLETEFSTDTGSVEVIDFMPIRQGADSAVIRIVAGLEGEVAIRSEFRARFDYGSVAPWYSEEDGAIIGKVGPDLIAIRSDITLTRDDETITARFVIKSGERIAFTLQHDGSTSPAPGPLDAQRLLVDTKSWWLDWIAAFNKESDWSDFIKRSLITLKALTYFPTGGIVAAGTTGLPELPGGSMNWDYRYCWLRDSTFTLTAFINAGFHGEAQSWLHWLLRAIAGDPGQIRVAYRVDGGRHLDEWKADWLPGFENSQPVLIGNSAARQRQLDIFGEVIDSTRLAERAGLDRSDWEFEVERRLVLHIEKTWRAPDQGLWESRGKARNFVYSKVMAWVGVDRFLSMEGVKKHCDSDLIVRFEALRSTMHAEICALGYSETRKTFTSYYGSSEVDGGLLLLPLVRFLPVDDPRMAGTIAAVEAKLIEGGLVRRKAAPLFGSEQGTFIACSCWLANCMVLQGRKEEARALLNRVKGIANDVGLLSEEYHVARGCLLGNIPQALSHLAFINAALSLEGSALQRGGG